MATAASLTPFTILPGSASDAPEIEELSAGAFDPGFREAWNARQIVQAVAAPGGFLHVARAERLLGFALCRSVADECELLLCAVSPLHRRAGIARALLDASMARGRDRGMKRIYLEVRESNLPARRLYECAGFRPIGLRPGYYRGVTGQSVAAITLSRTLDEDH
jgi:ribosomal-protein-alanine N-acetyltransferase